MPLLPIALAACIQISNQSIDGYDQKHTQIIRPIYSSLGTLQDLHLPIVEFLHLQHAFYFDELLNLNFDNFSKKLYLTDKIKG